MVRIDWRTLARACSGFLLGLGIWIGLSPLYGPLLARGAQFAIRSFERPPVTTLRAGDGDYTIVNRSDFDPRSPRPGIAIRDRTFNIVLLTTLFALARRPLADRNVGRYLLASLLLVPTHLFAVITQVMSIYVLQLGPWSRASYGDVSRYFWGVADHSYRLVLMYAVAFGLWWALRPGEGRYTPGQPQRFRERR